MVGIPDNYIRQNIGSSTNKGFEVGVNADVIKKEDFSWTVGGNVSFVKNEITALVDGGDILFNIDSNRQQVGILRIGESIRSLYGFEYYGVNAANGNPIYYKADGSLVQQDASNGAVTVYNAGTPGTVGAASNLNSDDKKILGNTIPKYFGSLSTTVKYKIMSKGSFINYDNVATSRFVEDGSFVKIDNISLGYTLPKDLISQLGLSGFRIFTTVQNAFTFTKYKGIDPELEVSGVDFNAAPRQRTLSVGLNASF